MRANLPKGVGGGPGNMQAMIRQAQKMQEDMQALQEELDAKEYDVSAGGGMVNVKITGKKEILAIDIKPDIVDPDDIETLSDILVAAVNQAIKQVETTNNEAMEKVTGNIPTCVGNTYNIILIHFF
jgi:DNA-binding YbaB/EbfC family protein